MIKIIKIMLIVFAIFLIWMTFFDESSFLNRRKLNKKINEERKEINFYKSEIKKDKKGIEDIQNKDSLEKYAREKYNMKKENEEIFLIEFDTVIEK